MRFHTVVVEQGFPGTQDRYEVSTVEAPSLKAAVAKELERLQDFTESDVRYVRTRASDGAEVYASIVNLDESNLCIYIAATRLVALGASITDTAEG